MSKTVKTISVGSEKTVFQNHLVITIASHCLFIE